RQRGNVLSRVRPAQRGPSRRVPFFKSLRSFTLLDGRGGRLSERSVVTLVWRRTGSARVNWHRHGGGVQGIYSPLLRSAARLQPEVRCYAVCYDRGGADLPSSRYALDHREPEAPGNSKTVSRRSGFRPCLVSLQTGRPGAQRRVVPHRTGRTHSGSG